MTKAPRLCQEQQILWHLMCLFGWHRSQSQCSNLQRILDFGKYGSAFYLTIPHNDIFIVVMLHSLLHFHSEAERQGCVQDLLPVISLSETSPNLHTTHICDAMCVSVTVLMKWDLLRHSFNYKCGFYNQPFSF